MSSYWLPPRTIIGVNRPATFQRTLLGREILGFRMGAQHLGYSGFLGKIHPMTLSDVLIGKKHPIGTAEHTLQTALSALKRGDRRLASSRAVTAVAQAAAAAVGASSDIIDRAEKVVFEARRLIQSLVIARAARLGYLSRFCV